MRGHYGGLDLTALERTSSSRPGHSVEHGNYFGAQPVEVSVKQQREGVAPKRIGTTEELLRLLDRLAARHGHQDRTQREAAPDWEERLLAPEHPLAHDLPDEALVSWHSAGLLGDLRGARVVDIGCGNGRNSRWMAHQGAEVLGIDMGESLLEHCRSRATLTEQYLNLDVVRDELPDITVDFAYDSGCFHHIPPHRRATYRERILALLKPQGSFGIVTFNADCLPTPGDEDLVMNGGVGTSFTQSDLQHIFQPLVPVAMRPLRSGVTGTFAPDFLHAVLFRRPA